MCRLTSRQCQLQHRRSAMIPLVCASSVSACSGGFGVLASPEPGMRCREHKSPQGGSSGEAEVEVAAGSEPRRAAARASESADMPPPAEPRRCAFHAGIGDPMPASVLPLTADGDIRSKVRSDGCQVRSSGAGAQRSGMSTTRFVAQPPNSVALSRWINRSCGCSWIVACWKPPPSVA